MRKGFYLSILLVLAACLAFVGCSNEPEHVDVSGKCVGFDTLEEMEAYSDVIVECVRQDEVEAVIKKNDERVFSTYSFSQVQVTKVHADTFGVLEAGSIITILENEAFDAEENLVYHVGGYRMMVPGESYLLFLTKHTLTSGREYHVASGVNAGTVSLGNDGRTNGATSRSSDSYLDSGASRYSALWQEAIDKYVN